MVRNPESVAPLSTHLKFTNRSFRYASPCLWNQLLLSFRQSHSNHSPSHSSHLTYISSLFSSSPSLSSITPSLFHSWLKTNPFRNPTHRRLLVGYPSHWTAFTDLYCFFSDFLSRVYTRTLPAATSCRQHVSCRRQHISCIGNIRQQNCCQFVARQLLDTKDTSRP